MIAITSQGGAKEAVRRCEEALRLEGGSRAGAVQRVRSRPLGPASSPTTRTTAWSHALAARDMLPLDGGLTISVLEHRRHGRPDRSDRRRSVLR